MTCQLFLGGFVYPKCTWVISVHFFGNIGIYLLLFVYLLHSYSHFPRCFCCSGHPALTLNHFLSNLIIPYQPLLQKSHPDLFLWECWDILFQVNPNQSIFLLCMGLPTAQIKLFFSPFPSSGSSFIGITSSTEPGGVC